MSSLFKKIKSISQWEKDLAIGYCKEAQKLVMPNQIPSAISYLCLVYYYQYDYFNKCDDGLEINERKDTVTKIKEDEDAASAEGFMEVTKGEMRLIYSWTFQVSGMWDSRMPTIGIFSSYEPCEEGYQMNANGWFT